MLNAKLAVIRAQFFLLAVAWRTPSASSTRPFPAWAARPTGTFWVLPETAAIGETFAARFAGACAASSTVTTPTTAPAHRPAGLSCQTGVAANSPPMPYRSAAQIVQLAKVPSTRPMGTAVLHQLRASSRTNRMTCRLLMPMQRIMPKNWVRWARLLFMLPEIISTPASSTSTNSTAAIPYTV